MKGSVLALVLCMADTALGGNSSGSGGNREEISRVSAWFLNRPGQDNEVAYCVESDAGFYRQSAKTADASARQTVDDAIRQWSEYLFVKGLDSTASMPFAYRFVARDACRGDEDLTVYLGGFNDRTRVIIDNNHEPVGITYKESYDYARLWSRGFIWIAPEFSYEDRSSPGTVLRFPAWRAENRLKAALLHELGHVFGSPHVDGTIMREDIWKLTVADRIPEMGFEEIYRGRIDHQHELMHQRMAGTEDPSDYEIGYVHDGLYRLMAEVFGRPVSGKLRAEIKDHEFLIVSDDAGRYEFGTSFMTNRIHAETNGLFRQSWSEGTYYSEDYKSATWYGQMTLPGEQKIPLIYEYNASEFPITFSSNRNGSFEPFVSFRSKY